MNNPYHFGAKGDGLTDDTDALGRWVQAGGGEIPAGVFRFNGPLRYESGFEISRWEGKLLYCEGWASGYALCTRGPETITQGVRIDATAGGELIYYGISGRPRKGIGLTWLENFELVYPTVVGGAADKGINLFSCEVRGSRRGKIRGGRFSVLSGQQGADGIHFTQSCSDIELIEINTASGDDSAGITVEIPSQAGSILEKINFTRCNLDNVGHSSIKILLASVAGESIVRDVTFNNCTMRTTLHPLGAGVPVIIDNLNKAGGSRIERITISGGRSEVIIPNDGHQGGTAIQLRCIDDMHVINHDIQYWSKTVLEAWNCNGLVVDGGRYEALRPLPNVEQVPMFRMRNCDDAHIMPGYTRPAWINQLVTLDKRGN